MSAPVVEYTIARGINPVELAEAVNELIAQGWQPQGGVVCRAENGSYLYQAMVKDGKQ